MESSSIAKPSSRSSVPRLLAGWQMVVVLYIASRLVIFALIGLARLVFVKADCWHPGGIFSCLLQWDAELWYVSIARFGYYYDPVGPSSMGFFPFYPLTIRAFSLIFHDMRVAAVVSAHVCFLIAALALNALINLDYDDRRINRGALAFLMFGPVSFFFSNAYTESTFLMLSVCAFLAARKRRWFLACLLGGCLSATRNVGLLIGLPLFIEWARQRWETKRSWKAFFDPSILYFAIIPLGLGAFMLYGYLKFDEPFAYLHATRVGWGREFTPPWQTLRNVRLLPDFYRVFFPLMLASGVGLWLAAFYFRLRASYIVYAALLITIYACGNSLEAIARYLSVVFPLFIVIGALTARWRWTYPPLFAASTALLTLCTIMSAMGYWIT